MNNLRTVFENIDWQLLSEQKLGLLKLVWKKDNPAIDGIIAFLDGVQDAAELDGFPVVWLGDAEDEAASSHERPL
jgi:hypothetical protein